MYICNIDIYVYVYIQYMYVYIYIFPVKLHVVSLNKLGHAPGSALQDVEIACIQPTTSQLRIVFRAAARIAQDLAGSLGGFHRGYGM